MITIPTNNHLSPIGFHDGANFYIEKRTEIRTPPLLDSMIYYLTEGGFIIPKGIPNKKYTPEFKKMAVETMQAERLSYHEAVRRFDISSDTRVVLWHRIYLEEDLEILTIERRGYNPPGRPHKLPKEVEADLIAENQRLRMEIAY